MIVQMEHGAVEGVGTPGGAAFKGIPFAAPPRRFHPPEPPEPWTGVRPACEYGPAAPQPRDPILEELFGQPPFPTAEAGCLTLNVWTPGTSGARPVLVWIHGGAFITGSGRDPVFDGRQLATRQDLVVVTLNYRLGALGFLHLGGETGNLGLLDQVAALRWVRDNIAAFGGDPGNVTLFGQSAGAMCIAALLTAPVAAGLFHKAIVQSGSAEHVHSAERAAAVTSDLVQALNGADPSAVPAAKLIRAQQAVAEAMRAGGEGLGLPFAPVVDGAVLPEVPLNALAAGAGIPLLLGSTREEERLFTGALPAPEAARLADELFHGPADRLAAAHSGPVWRYLFGWGSPTLGACHSMDLPFVFGNLDSARRFTGPGAPRELADAMGAAWASFARDGVPGWSAYTPDDKLTMVFDTVSSVVADPERQTLEGNR